MSDNPVPMHTTTKRRLWIAAGYLLTALLLSVALLSDLVLGDALEDLRTFVAGAVATTLGFFGVPVTSHGSLISGPGSPLRIVNECTGLDAMILVVSAVVVLPASWHAKLVGIGLSILVLSVVNFIRVVTLVLVGSYFPEWLDVSHLYIWPVIVILAGIGVLSHWADRVESPRTA